MAEKNGYLEVVLVGVNIGKYSYKGTDLAKLLKIILDMTTIPRIRLTSIHPEDVSDDLVRLIGSNSRICNHLHLSVQSGSDRILKQMNRRYDSSQIYSLIERLRADNSNFALTADIIVGFPSETTKNFGDT